MIWFFNQQNPGGLWGRLIICGRLAIGLRGLALTTKRITNPLQVNNLPHNSK